MATAARTAAPVREPTDDEFEAFENLTDILAWAGVKGNPEVEYTQSGALMVAIAGDEFKTITAAEFASISSEDFEAALAEWKFSQYDNDYEFGTPDCNLSPNALIKGRARAAHRAARIWQKLEFSTNATNAYNVWVDESVIKAKTTIAAPPAAAPAPAGEIVRLHETVDFTRVREVHMMTSKEHLTGLDLFYKLMHREPFPPKSRHSPR